MQNIVAHGVNTKRPVPRGNRQPRGLCGLFCSVCKATGGVWAPPSVCAPQESGGGREVMSCENSIKRSRGKYLCWRNKRPISVIRVKTGPARGRGHEKGWGEGGFSWFLQGLLLSPAGETQADACPPLNSCSRSRSRMPGLLPHEPSPGQPGADDTEACPLRHFQGFLCL